MLSIQEKERLSDILAFRMISITKELSASVDSENELKTSEIAEIFRKSLEKAGTIIRLKEQITRENTIRH